MFELDTNPRSWMQHVHIALRRSCVPGPFTSFSPPAVPNDSLNDVARCSQEGGSFDPNDRKKGPSDLTSRELEILQLLADGDTNLEIARRLLISPRTVKNHWAHIYQKLGAVDRGQALARAARLGLVHFD